MLKSILTSPTLMPILMGQVRHVVTIAGTTLATTGLIGGSDVEAFTGAVVVLVSLALSALSKKLAV